MLGKRLEGKGLGSGTGSAVGDSDGTDETEGKKVEYAVGCTTGRNDGVDRGNADSSIEGVDMGRRVGKLLLGARLGSIEGKGVGYEEGNEL